MSDSPKDIAKMKVADLKQELKMRGLSTVGNKVELQERLQKALQDGTDTSLLLDDTGPVDTEDILNEDDVLADEDDSNTVTPDEGNTSLKRHLDDDLEEEDTVTSAPADQSIVIRGQDNGPPTKKITLNRKAVTAVTETSDNTDSKKTQEGEGDKKVVKLSSISMKERLELRAAKFGAPATDAAKKEARVARFGSNSLRSAGSVPEASADLLKKRAERFGIQPGSKVEKVEMEEKKKKRLERFGGSSVVSSTATNGSAKQSIVKTETNKPTVPKPGRIPITAPSGATSSSSSNLDEKKKMRAERFKANTPITTK